MPTVYDAIVLGVGGFGSGALYHLASRGVRVLGIEQFGVAHDRGSSHGQTRIIRQAYFEHPDYVPLLQRAYELWHALARETRTTLFHQVGLFIAGKPDCESVAGTLLAAERHQLPVVRLTPPEARRRFSGFRFDDDHLVVFEEAAGYLEVETCVAAHIEAARAHGAELHTNETVSAIEQSGSGIKVRTDRGEYAAGRLIVTAGPWAARCLDTIDWPRGTRKSAGGDASGSGRFLQVVRKPLFWFPARDDYDSGKKASTFFFETDEGQFYGFPRIDGKTIKVAEHTGGDPVDDPHLVDRSLHDADAARVAAFVQRYLPGVTPSVADHRVCLYTRSPDGHFIVDRHPLLESVILAAGFSGHGFKFTSVLGEALADLALEGTTPLPIGFLRLDRLKERGHDVLE